MPNSQKSFGFLQNAILCKMPGLASEKAAKCRILRILHFTAKCRPELQNVINLIESQVLGQLQITYLETVIPLYCKIQLLQFVAGPCVLNKQHIFLDVLVECFIDPYRYRPNWFTSFWTQLTYQIMGWALRPISLLQILVMISRHRGANDLIMWPYLIAEIKPVIPRVAWCW